MKNPRSSPKILGSTTNTPWITSDSRTSANEGLLVQVDGGVVADHQPQRPRAFAGAGDLHLAADERVGDRGDADDATLLEHDRVLQLAVADLAPRGDRRERSDVAVLDVGTAPDDRGTAHGGAHDG